jgi:hypothetical protein
MVEMERNYTLSKIMHEPNKIKITKNGEKALMRFQRIMYFVMAINIMAAITAIAVLMFLSGVIK